jgi:hypothetical protein
MIQNSTDVTDEVRGDAKVAIGIGVAQLRSGVAAQSRSVVLAG